MSTKNVNMPFQIQTIIDSMLNKSDNVHLRGNYRVRLETIKGEIDKALKLYDQELLFQEANKSKKIKGKKQRNAV